MPDDEKSAPEEVTQLLRRYGEGESECLNQAIALVYDELHHLARQQLRRSKVGHHIETTVLVNEAYEKLVRGKTQQLQDRRHFFAIASRVMRQIVVDHYRASLAVKRGGEAQFVTASSNELRDLGDPEQLVAVHQALERLAAHNQDLVDTLDMACFGGLSNQAIAELTDCNVRTVQRKLQRAQAWLAHFMTQP